jgi:hypothetical protein
VVPVKSSPHQRVVAAAGGEQRVAAGSGVHVLSHLQPTKLCKMCCVVNQVVS